MGFFALDVATKGLASEDVGRVVWDFGLNESVWAFQRDAIEVPGLDEPWTVGAIVGPSGSGKSLLAQRVFGGVCSLEAGWPEEKAVIDAVGAQPLMRKVQALTAVGLGSVPTWVRPYSSLSQGERYRAGLAREFLRQPELLVCDEWTSVLDRDTARFASYAAARAVRRGGGPKRLVVVSCHTDVCDWLEADWVVDLASQTLRRGPLRRPSIELEITRCRNVVWRWFKDVHYLNGAINRTCRSFVATWEGKPVAFVGMLRSIAKRPIRRISRLVVLPTYQGCGIGTALLDWVGAENAAEGYYTTITAVHPAVEAWLKKSGRWKIWSAINRGFDWRSFMAGQGVQTQRAGRAVTRAEYVGFERLQQRATPASPAERKKTLARVGV